MESEVEIKGVKMGVFFDKSFPEDVGVLFDYVHMDWELLFVEAQQHIAGHFFPINRKKFLTSIIKGKLNFSLALGNIAGNEGRWKVMGHLYQDTNAIFKASIPIISGKH